MNSVLRADELVMRITFLWQMKTCHQWVNEHNGRTGMLTVSGALLSSPCTLETNEVDAAAKKHGRHSDALCAEAESAGMW
ncbi:pilus-assembly fibrillin subunit [Escherichia coli]